MRDAVRVISRRRNALTKGRLLGALIISLLSACLKNNRSYQLFEKPYRFCAVFEMSKMDMIDFISFLHHIS